MILNLDNYRSTREYREILRILQRSSALQENIVWQSHALGKTIIPIQHLEIDFVSREVVVSFDPHLYKIEPELPIYVKLDYRTTVFKVSNFRATGSSLHFSFPGEIKTQEFRVNPRYNLIKEEMKYVTLRPSIRGNGYEFSNELKVRAVDISYFGLGLIVSEQNRQFLKNNRILWITGLQDYPLTHPILAEVVYMNSEVDPVHKTDKKTKELKVGLKLSGVFPEDVFRGFIQ